MRKILLIISLIYSILSYSQLETLIGKDLGDINSTVNVKGITYNWKIHNRINNWDVVSHDDSIKSYPGTFTNGLYDLVIPYWYTEFKTKRSFFLLVGISKKNIDIQVYSGIGYTLVAGIEFNLDKLYDVRWLESDMKSNVTPPVAGWGYSYIESIDKYCVDHQDNNKLGYIFQYKATNEVCCIKYDIRYIDHKTLENIAVEFSACNIEVILHGYIKKLIGLQTNR